MLNGELLEYLKGEKFHNGLSIRVGKTPLITEHDYLKSVSEGKKVIHFGFLDHIELIDKKIKAGKWLHKILMDNTELCVGLDVNEEGIEYVKGKYGIENVYIFDVMNDEIPDIIKSNHYDLMLIPQVIEHIGNPVEFLVMIRKKFKKYVEKFVITVPNAFRLVNWKYAFSDIEVINTDHRFWFTFYTVSKVCVESGYQIEKILFVNHDSSFKDNGDLFLISEHPMLRDTILLECI